MILDKVCVLLYDPKINTSDFSIWFNNNNERRIKLGMRSTFITNDLTGTDKKTAVLLQSRSGLNIDIVFNQNTIDSDDTEYTERSIQNSFEVGSITLNNDTNDHIKYDLEYYFGLNLNLNANNSRVYSSCCVIDKFKHTFSFIPIGSSLTEMRITYYVKT